MRVVMLTSKDYGKMAVRPEYVAVVLPVGSVGSVLLIQSGSSMLHIGVAEPVEQVVKLLWPDVVPEGGEGGKP